MRLRRVSTRRSFKSALGAGWITSPRTGARLRRDDPPQDDADVLAVRRMFKQGMGRFPAHVHLDFAEHFEVLTGAAETAIDGDKMRLTAGDGRSTLYVPPGVPHVNPYNAERGPLELRQSFLPATEGASSYLETLAAVLEDGRDDDGELPWPLVLAVADITGERSYLTPVFRKHPRSSTWSFALQRRVLLPVGQVLAGTADYYVHLAPEHEVTQGLRKKAAGQAAEAPEIAAEAPEMAAEAPEMAAEAPQTAAEAPEIAAEAPHTAAEPREVAATRRRWPPILRRRPRKPQDSKDS